MSNGTMDGAVYVQTNERSNRVIAFRRAEDGALSELDAYELCSKVCKLHLTEMVDPNYVVIASIDKKYLPAKMK